jgi:hypothetical protein
MVVKYAFLTLIVKSPLTPKAFAKRSPAFEPVAPLRRFAQKSEIPPTAVGGLIQLLSTNNSFVERT